MKKPVKPSKKLTEPNEPDKPEEFKGIVVFRTPSDIEWYEPEYDGATEAGKIEIL